VRRVTDDYLAGIFDGEGSFTIVMCGKRLQARAQLSIREKYIVELLADRFGGFIRQNKARKAEHATTWRWNITGPNLLQFCLDMKELLLVKRSACLTVLEFQRLKTGNTSFRPMSDETRRQLEELHGDLRHVNRKGPGREYLSR